MADVFISYARADKARVAPLVAAIEAAGLSVWWDPEISPGREFDDAIDLELQAAKAVLVVWTPTSVASRWVRGEARDAADRNVLVPVRFEQARLPIDVRAIHTTDLDDWAGNAESAPMQECVKALMTTIARSQALAAKATPVATPASAAAEKAQPKFSICVLPFANMSGDPEQEYFSDGMTEDIITDLSNVSALAVASSNSTFAYKGQRVDIEKIASELKVTHVLEGSVRKAAGRLRINAQLIDGSTNNHVWAARYDRDASDIFAIQDEISQAIVKALKLKLLPEEKRAIERRGTDSSKAHDLYLMARQTYITGQEGDARTGQVIVRICKRVTEIDPGYADAWALMAAGFRQASEFGGTHSTREAMIAVERALALNPDLATAHAMKAQIQLLDGEVDAAAREVAIALKLDPESYEVNRAAARLSYQLRRYADAIRCYEKATALAEADVNSAAMLLSCYTAVNDTTNARRTAELTLKRAEAVLARDQNNASVMGYSVDALVELGEVERAKSRMERALLIEPDNFNMRYNFACMLNLRMRDREASLEMLEPLFSIIPEGFIGYAKADPDLKSLRGDPRFDAMVARAEARIAAAKAAAPAPAVGD